MLVVSQTTRVQHKHKKKDNHTPSPSPLSFRDDDGSICAPAEVRLCRFMASEPAALPPIRLVGENREDDNPPGRPVVVDDRGRVAEAASFGSTEFALREALWGVPDARFLHNISLRNMGDKLSCLSHRFLITSVFNDSGRTTP